MTACRAAVLIGLLVMCVATLDAQGPAVPPSVPLQVRVTISRLQGDRVVNNRPYVVSVNTNSLGGAQLRMGAQVPVPAMSTPTVDGKPVTGMLQVSPIQYRDIGTNIDVAAATLDGVQFDVQVSVQDTSVYLATDAIDGILKTGDLPVFRSFQMRNSAVLRDGQTTQFSAATDRVSGEIMRVEVTLNVVK